MKPLPLILLALTLCCCPRNGVQVPEADRIKDPKQLLTAVREKGKELSSVRAEGTILARRGGKRIKAHMILLLRRPATLRFETISFFEQPMSILVTDGMKFSLWDMDKGRFYQGPATPQNISRVIPIPMDGPEVSGILFGDPPLIPFAESKLDFKDGLYILTLTNSQQQQTIKIHPTRLRPTEVLLKAGGKEYYHLVYDDWHDTNPPVLEKATFTMDSEDIRLTIKIREVERNVDLKDDLFVLTPPEGIPVERLVTERSKPAGMIVHGEDWAFVVREPEGWRGDCEDAAKLHANVAFYRSTESFGTMSSVIRIRVNTKVDEDTAKDLAHDMQGYRAEYPKLKFEDLEVSHMDYRLFPKLFYVPDSFYEYVVYMNPGNKFKYTLSISMNIQKRPATKQELMVFKEIVSTLIFMKKYDEKHPPPGH